MTQQQKEELKKEFYKFCPGAKENLLIADYWLSVFDQLIQEKVEKIEKMSEGETYQSKEFAYKEGFYQARVKAVAILKE